MLFPREGIHYALETSHVAPTWRFGSNDFPFDACKCADLMYIQMSIETKHVCVYPCVISIDVYKFTLSSINSIQNKHIIPIRVLHRTTYKELPLCV